MMQQSLLRGFLNKISVIRHLEFDNFIVHHTPIQRFLKDALPLWGSMPTCSTISVLGNLVRPKCKSLSHKSKVYGYCNKMTGEFLTGVMPIVSNRLISQLAKWLHKWGARKLSESNWAPKIVLVNMHLTGRQLLKLMHVCAHATGELRFYQCKSTHISPYPSYST